MPTPLQALIVEDSIADIEILLHELKKSDFDIAWRSIGTEQELLAEVRSAWDIALLDYHLPQFDTMRAIRLLRERDVNVPVIVITGQIQSPPEVERLLATNIEGAERMHCMVKDLLAYTKIVEDVAASAPLNDAERLLAQALKDLSQTVRDTGAEITNDPLPHIRIHGVHLTQLFQNLISNSLKYRHPDRRPVIHISAERSGGDWTFAVRDNGIGFDPGYSERIFGLFKRLHARDEYAGNGIGLALCARIVKHYGGRIWASAELEQGATFCFTVTSNGSHI